MGDASKPAEDGFEYDGTFYRWSLSDQGKDLMLIDRLTAMPIVDFFAAIEDGFDRERAPILLAMIATSIRAGHPDWSVERISRTVMNLNLSEVTFIEADREEDPRPPEQPAHGNGSEPSSRPSDGSSSSPTPEETESSRMSYAAPV